MEKDKGTRISEEVKRLQGIYRKIGPKRKRAMEGLIQRAAFMRVTLEDYEEDINENGSVEQFTQSEKTEPYERERPVARLYNTMSKNYAAVVKQLSESIVEDPPRAKDKNDAFDAFVLGRDDG